MDVRIKTEYKSGGREKNLTRHRLVAIGIETVAIKYMGSSGAVSREVCCIKRSDIGQVYYL